MAGSHGKKDKVYAALSALMAKPGDPLSISSELIRADHDILSDELAKLIEPYPKMDDRELAIVFSSQIEIGLEKRVFKFGHTGMVRREGGFCVHDTPLC